MGICTPQDGEIINSGRHLCTYDLPGEMRKKVWLINFCFFDYVRGDFAAKDQLNLTNQLLKN